MEKVLPTVVVTSNDNQFFPITLMGRPLFVETILPVNRKSVPYERIIEGNQGIRVEVTTNERGGPIIAITRINRDGETLCSDGTPGGITCYHHNQLFVSEQHQFDFLNFNIDVEVHWSGHTVSLSYVGLDTVSALIEVKKTFWRE